jgi:hypothetical protein
VRRLILFATIAFSLSGCGDDLSENAVSSSGGLCPETHPIKGNRNDRGEWIYHKPEQQYYKKTNAEECFSTDDDALEAGYRKSKR